MVCGVYFYKAKRDEDEKLNSGWHESQQLAGAWEPGGK